MRANIINDPNKRQCPEPDCDSYLEKTGENNYVKCKKGHEYCFECLRKPHGNSTCDEFLEKELLIWKKNKHVKRCPKCKIFTEKNEGCNHMTCVNCKYQWCWLCEEKYTYEHYSSGKCKGHQFTRADNVKEANRSICCITLNTFFPCFYKEVHGSLGFEHIWENYLFILIFWFFGYFLFAGFSMMDYSDDKIQLKRAECMFHFCGCFIALYLFVCFQILFFCLITPFMLIALVYPNFVNNIGSFFCIGDE